MVVPKNYILAVPLLLSYYRAGAASEKLVLLAQRWGGMTEDEKKPFLVGSGKEIASFSFFIFAFFCAYCLFLFNVGGFFCFFLPRFPLLNLVLFSFSLFLSHLFLTFPQEKAEEDRRRSAAERKEYRAKVRAARKAHEQKEKKRESVEATALELFK